MPNTISIILPTYNRAHILEKCIHTIITQTYQNWELLILDDCSTDQTQKIGENIAASYPDKIRYHRNKKRQFQQGNKNCGISLAKSPLIFFMEDDVFLAPDCLANLVNHFESLSQTQKIGAIAPRLISKKDNINRFSHTKKPFIFNKYSGEIYLNYWIEGDCPIETFTLHACSLVRKELIHDVGGFSHKRYIGNCFREETDFFCKIRQKGFKLYYDPTACAIHKHESIGGCRVEKKYTLHYYMMRNHAVFLIHFLPIRSLYMIPCFVIEYSFRQLLPEKIICKIGKILNK